MMKYIDAMTDTVTVRVSWKRKQRSGEEVRMSKGETFYIIIALLIYMKIRPQKNIDNVFLAYN